MKSDSEKESKKKLKDKCSNCGSTKSDSYWDYDDNSVLCQKCHSEIGKGWQIKIDEKKVKKKENKLRIEETKSSDDDTKGVGGWLAFFVFGLCISILLNLYLGISDISGVVALQLPPEWSTGLILLDVLMFGGLIGYIIYTIVCLTSLKSNAVSTAKKYLLFMLISSIVGLFLEIYNPTLYSEETSFSGGTIRGIIFSGIWLAYFSSSKRVANTWPESKRETTLVENIWFYCLVFLQFIVLLLGLLGGSAQ